MCVGVQTGRSQLRRYKAKKSLVPEGEAAAEQAKPKSQILEFWLVRENCDKGSLMVRFTPPPSSSSLALSDHHCRMAHAVFLLAPSCVFRILQEHKMNLIVACLLAVQAPTCLI